MQRSGTTLMGALLHKSADIQVFNEIPNPSRFPALGELVRQYQEWTTSIMARPYEAWRGVNEEVAADGVERLFHAYCSALRPVVSAEQESERWDAGLKDAPLLNCLKTPNAELDHETYDALFTHRRPHYLYCIRDPHSVYESTLSTPWGSERTPEDFLNRLRRSLLAIERIQRASEHERVFSIDIDRVSSDGGLRRRVISSLFEHLQIDETAATRSFVSEWPGINRTKMKFTNQTFLPESEKLERLRAFSELYDGAPEIAESLSALTT
jgi:hypothetical protein